MLTEYHIEAQHFMSGQNLIGKCHTMNISQLIWLLGKYGWIVQTHYEHFDRVRG